MALRSFVANLSLVSLAAPAVAYAQIQCPSPPQQVSKDATVAVQVAVGRLGPVKAGEFSTNVQNTTRDLLGSLPKGDRVYLEQMMFAAFCSSLQSDNSLSGQEKTKALRDYAREVRQTVSPASSPSPNPELRKEPPAPSAPPVKTGGFSKLLDVFGLPQSAQIGWNADYETLEKLLPAAERAISRTDVLAVDGKTSLAGVPARTSYVFENRKLTKVTVSVAASYYEWRQWVLREPPAPERGGTTGNVDLGKRICSPAFSQLVDSRASSIFSKVADRETKSDSDSNYSKSSWECNKYGCTSSAKTAKTTASFKHAEASEIEMLSNVWNGVAKYSTGSKYDGGEQNDWQCDVRLTFSPRSKGGI